MDCISEFISCNSGLAAFYLEESEDTNRKREPFLCLSANHSFSVEGIGAKVVCL